MSRSAYNREYYLKNKERILQKKKEQRKENSETLNERSRKWRLENPDKQREANKNWVVKNYQKKLQTNNVRSKRTRRATPRWLSDEQVQQIKDFYWLAKDLEAVTGETYHVDHIVPLKGENVSGLNVPWNLQVLPADINLKKGNKHVD